MIWAISLCAYRQRTDGAVQVKHASAYSGAPTEAEATGWALIRVKKLCPERNGWTGHSVTAGPIPDHDLRAGLTGDGT